MAKALNDLYPDIGLDTSRLGLAQSMIIHKSKGKQGKSKKKKKRKRKGEE